MHLAGSKYIMTIFTTAHLIRNVENATSVCAQLWSPSLQRFVFSSAMGEHLQAQDK